MCWCVRWGRRAFRALGPQGPKVSPNAQLTCYTFRSSRVGRNKAKLPVQRSGSAARGGAPFHAASSYSSPDHHTPAATCPACYLSTAAVSCGWGERLAQRCDRRLAAVSSRCGPVGTHNFTSLPIPRAQIQTVLSTTTDTIICESECPFWSMGREAALFRPAVFLISSHSFLCASAVLMHRITTREACYIVSFTRRLRWHARRRLDNGLLRALPLDHPCTSPNTQTLPGPLGSPA